MKQILLVDDEANITRSIRRVCRTKDYSILVAKSASKAIELLSENEIQVILSDQLMPGMSGAELFEIIQKSHPRIVRILLTGYTAIEGLTSAVNQGAVFRILFKPWDDDNLLKTIDDAFDYYLMKDKNRQLAQELTELNQTLEARVKQKTQELTHHIKRLQVSHKIFNLLPYFTIGLSDDLYIVEANLQAREFLDSDALIGNKAELVLPEEILNLISKSTHSDSGTTLTTTLKNSHIKFTCTKVEMAKDSFGYLVYGGTGHE